MKRTFALFFLLWLLPEHSLPAAQPEGYVIEWGWNTAAAIPAPAKLATSNAVAIAAGVGYSLVLRTDGTVEGWGDNYAGKVTGVPATNAPYVSAGRVRIRGELLRNVSSIVADREFSLALKSDGAIVTWGNNYVPKGLSNILAIAADEFHSWVLKHDGTVVGWWKESSPSYEILPVQHLTNVVSIAVNSGGYGTRGVALKRDGTVGHWGSETDYQDATPPPGLSNVVAIAAGASHSLALRTDGTVVGWGWNKVGEATGNPTTNGPNLAFYSAGQVQIDGQVLRNVTSIAASRGYSMGLKNDGTIVAWGRMVNDLYPVTVPEGLSNVVAIAAGENFCLAITTNRVVADRFRR